MKPILKLTRLGQAAIVPVFAISLSLGASTWAEEVQTTSSPPPTQQPSQAISAPPATTATTPAPESNPEQAPPVVKTEEGTSGPPTNQAANDDFMKGFEDIPKLGEEATLEDIPTDSQAAGKKTVTARAVIVDIDSQTLKYDDVRDVYVAEGEVHVVISEQNSEMIADKVTYDKNKQNLVAEGNVVIIRNGQKTLGTYARIDLTRESALISDPVTKLETVRVRAKQAFVNNDYLELENGRLILDGRLISGKLNRQKRYRQSASIEADMAQDAMDATVGLDDDPPPPSSSNVSLAPGESDDDFMTEVQDLSRTVSHNRKGPAMASNLFNFKVKDITVKRGDDGIDDITLSRPKVLMKNKYPVAYLPTMDFAYEQSTGWLEYLGPDMGFDADLGGMYYGPGWDYKVGKGFIRVSPLLTLGSARERVDGGRGLESKGFGPGIGGMVHYQARNTRIDLGYTTSANQIVGFAEQKFFAGNTRLLVSNNQNYQTGFLGGERPNFMAQLIDTRKLATLGAFDLNSFGSMGVARDEYFPTNQERFFVDAKNSDPLTAGRAQFQLRLRNNRPLLKVGNTLSFGFEGQLGGSAYTTGDFFGIGRLGPTMKVKLGNRWVSDVRYLVGNTVGETPFVFDAFYRGRQNLILRNAFRVNDYLTLGTRNDLNLERDNDKGALAVGNQVFALVGPKDVKLRLAYDVIRRRSFFGIDFYPGGGDTNIDYDRLRIFQPQNYTTNPDDDFGP